jgi:hypothetical protein
MNSRVVQQMEREAESWKRLLEFLQEESVHLKIRIAEIASQDMDKELLAEAENFQNRFMQQEEIIALARRDVAAFERLAGGYATDSSDKKISHAQKKLRKDIGMLEQAFHKLKFEFNQYLAEKL